MNARTLLGATALALTLAIAPGARAQDDSDQSIVVTIVGPCELTLAGRPVDCSGVAYMAFPATHRINFTAVTQTAGWAFSGEEDDNDDGDYTLTLDSVLTPAAGRVEAEGECQMQVDQDRRTVRSIDCNAKTDAGVMRLKASGVIAEADDDDDDDDSARG